MARLSIEVTGKIRSGLFLLSALLEQGPTVAGLVMEKLHAGLQRGHEPPPFLTQLQALGQILKTALDLVVELDGLTVDENNLRAFLFDDREKKIAALGGQFFSVRQIVTGYYVDPDLKRLGFEGETPRESIALLRLSERLCDRFESDDLEGLLGEARFEPAPDLRPLVPQVRPFIAVLRDAFEAHQRSRRRLDELLAKKKKAVEEYDTVFVRVARQFEDLCRLAGLDDLAAKVRPSVRRRGETEVRPDDGEVPDAAQGAGAASAAPAEGASASPAEPEPAGEPDSETGAEPVGEPKSETGDEPASAAAS